MHACVCVCVGGGGGFVCIVGRNWACLTWKSSMKVKLLLLLLLYWYEALPVPALTPERQAPSMVTRRVPMVKSLMWLDQRELFVGCSTSQQHASVSQGRICSDSFTGCHTETEVADQTFHLTPSQYTDTGPTSPSTDSVTPDAWQGSHWSAKFEVTGMTRPRKNPGASGIRTRDLPLSRRTPYH